MKYMIKHSGLFCPVKSMEEENYNGKSRCIPGRKVIVLMQFIGLDIMSGLFLGIMKQVNVLSRDKNQGSKIRRTWASGRCG